MFEFIIYLVKSVGMRYFFFSNTNLLSLTASSKLPSPISKISERWRLRVLLSSYISLLLRGDTRCRQRDILIEIEFFGARKAA